MEYHTARHRQSRPGVNRKAASATSRFYIALANLPYRHVAIPDAEVGRNAIPPQRLSRRKHARRSVFLVGQVTTPTGIYECRVLNLSPNGAKLKLSTFVWTNQPISLALDSLGVFIGVVAWRRDGCVGITIKEHRPAKRPAAAIAPARGPRAGLRGIRVGGPAWTAELDDSESRAHWAATAGGAKRQSSAKGTTGERSR
jgi:hypothetical protein